VARLGESAWEKKSRVMGRERRRGERELETGGRQSAREGARKVRSE
jgi:hypothetical protein